MSNKLLFRLAVLVTAMMCALGAAAAEAYACYTSSNKTLTFYYDTQRTSRTGTTYDMNEGNDIPEWFNDIKTFVTAVVFDPSFDDARPQSTSHWFSNMKNLESITGMEYLHTNEVRTMKNMFATCSKLTEIDLSHFYTAYVTDMSGMFQFSNKLTSLDLSSFNTASVTTMSSMFTNCSGLTSLDLSNFNTANVTQMVLMFQNCSHLTSLDLTSFNTANVTDMRSMFYNCEGLTSLDLGQFNTANVTDMSQMFRFCIGLTTIYVGNGWNTDNVTSSSYMFSGATDLMGGQGTTYDASHTDKEYAHIDGGPSNPGYFTEWKEAYACFTWDNRTLTFYYDGQRNSRTGTTYDLNTGISSPRWHNNQSNILYVVFDPSFADARPTTTYCWFYNMGYIRSITGMSYLNTSNVTDMSFMFDLCEKLTNLDVSGFNTANVTNMTCMFAECSGLTSLDVSGFNTSNVTNMRCMFYNCKRLSSLDVSGFNTSNVTSMYLMFYNCEGLTSLDVSGFNTSNVTDMSYMFDYCEQLTSLDVSGFNTSNVTNMSYMFAGCEALTSLDVSGFNTSNVTNMSYMFAGCEALTSLDVSGFNTSNVTDMFAMFAICETLPSLDVSGFNTSNVTNMSYMFAGCEALTSLDVSHFNTEKVTNMTALFSTCLGLSSLDVSNFNTANVTEMNGMFWGCTGLTSLDLSGFNTSNVTDMKEMFRGCSNLATIYVGSGWNTDALTVSDDMFAESTNLVGGMGTTYDADHVDAEYAHIDGGPSNPGYFSEPPEAYAVYTSNNKTLTFYYDTYRDSRPGTSFDMNTDGNPPAWSAGYGNVITQVVIDPSFAGARPTTTHCWFFDLAKVTSITGLNYLNTEAVTRMSYMFAYSPALESLDLSHFNTANVTDMESMFAGSTALESLDLTSFNTENVTGMSYMFLDCTGLKSLDLTSFNTAGVRQLVSMFGNCSNLTTIYAGSDWSTVNYISSAGMFDNCTSLVGSKGTAYDANHVDAEYAHIDGGPSNPGYFSDKSLMPEAYAVYTEDNTTLTFYYDTQRDIRPGTAYDLNTGNNQPDWIIDEIYESVNRVVIAPSFDYARPVSTYMWFYCMENVQSIEGIEYLNTSEVTKMGAMFMGCSGLTNLDVSHFNTDKSTDMFNMFKECSSLTSLDLSSFNTAKVQDIRGMFQNCTGLTSLDLSGFNTAFVRSMSLMFYGCSHLTTIYAGDGWSNDALYTSSDMFQDCTALVGGKGTTYDASHTDAEYAHIDGGPSNPGYFTAKNAGLRGDVNGDGSVNISDVTALIDYLLSGDASAINTDAADGNQDSNVSIADVTALIDYLLSGSWN